VFDPSSDARSVAYFNIFINTAAAEEALGRFEEAAKSYARAVALEKKEKEKPAENDGASAKTAAAVGLERCRTKAKAKEEQEKARKMEQEKVEEERRRKEEKELRDKQEKESEAQPEKAEKEDGNARLQDFLNDVDTKPNENSGSKTAPPADPAAASEDDLLSSFLSSVEAPPAHKPAPPAPSAPRWKESAADLGDAAQQIERLATGPNAFWKNLNPFAVLRLPHTAEERDIAGRYRALASLVHPDKCRLEKADAAFDVLRRAHEILMRKGGEPEHPTKATASDADEAAEAAEGGLAGKDRKYVVDLVEAGLQRGKRDFERAKKQGILTRTLEETQERTVQKVFAELEYKRRDVEERLRKNEGREREQQEEEQNKLKREREFERGWRDGKRVNHRVGNWRNFNKKQKK